VKPAGWLALAAVASLATPARAVEAKHRSESATRQFTIYCEDTPLRQRVSSFAEEVKTQLLQLFSEERDGRAWKTPILITLDRATTLQSKAPPVTLHAVQSDFGFKIEITVRIGRDPAEVHLEKQIVRALLLGYAYGGRGLQRGRTFEEAPWWVIEGALEIFHRREQGIDTALFKRLLASGQLPSIEEFLPGKPADLGPAALALDRALAMALVEFLVEQPGGRAGLASLVRAWPHGARDPVASLLTAFPALASGQTIQRWWTLSLARLAASDRHEGLSIEDTNRELIALLDLTLPVEREGQRRTYPLRDYRAYLKNPASRPALLGRQAALVALSVRANALLRPAVREYEQIVGLLARGKARGMDPRFAQAEAFRQEALVRRAQIDDYLNWFEATQLGVRSHAFDSYLKTAAEIAEQEQRASDQITRYLDQLEKDL